MTPGDRTAHNAGFAGALALHALLLLLVAAALRPPLHPASRDAPPLRVWLPPLRPAPPTTRTSAARRAMTRPPPTRVPTIAAPAITEPAAALPEAADLGDQRLVYAQGWMRQRARRCSMRSPLLFSGRR